MHQMLIILIGSYFGVNPLFINTFLIASEILFRSKGG